MSRCRGFKLFAGSKIETLPFFVRPSGARARGWSCFKTKIFSTCRSFHLPSLPFSWVHDCGRIRLEPDFPFLFQSRKNDLTSRVIFFFLFLVACWLPPIPLVGASPPSSARRSSLFFELFRGTNPRRMWSTPFFPSLYRKHHPTFWSALRPHGPDRGRH